MDKPSKDIIGDYQRVRLIDDTGAQGSVWEARCTRADHPRAQAGQTVAVKILRRQPGDERSGRKFEKQAEILRAFDHPNIVRYIDSFVFEGDWEESRCLVMEYLAGTTLKEVIQAYPKGIPWETAHPLFLQCLEGLVYAGTHNVVHRDLKPSNIFVTQEQTVKLIDFGIAHRQDSATVSEDGPKGTFDFMAPDFVKVDNFKGDEQSDIFSFGVCLYQGLTGVLPFPSLGESANVHVGYFKRWSTDKSPEVRLNAGIYDVLRHLRTVVVKCLAVNRTERYKTFQQVLQEYRKIECRRIRGSEGAQYEMLEYVSEGGFGRVFRGRRLPDGRPVAVKSMIGQHSPERFVREAGMLRKLANPHLVEFLDFTQEETDGGDQRFFLIIEFLPGMPGSSLRGLIRSSGKGGLPVVDVVTLFVGYLAALKQLHAEGITHRDIKPSNLYAPEGHPENAKVFDLGIARDEKGTKTSGGFVPGTYEYMAPELFDAEHEGRGSPHMDVFALGLCLYEALTGKPAFPPAKGKDDGAVLMALSERYRQETPADYSHPVFSAYPELRDRILKRALAFAPARRFASAAPMHAELLKLQQRLTEAEGDLPTQFLPQFDPDRTIAPVPQREPEAPPSPEADGTRPGALKDIPIDVLKQALDGPTRDPNLRAAPPIPAVPPVAPAVDPAELAAAAKAKAEAAALQQQQADDAAKAKAEAEREQAAAAAKARAEAAVLQRQADDAAKAKATAEREQAAAVAKAKAEAAALQRQADDAAKAKATAEREQAAAAAKAKATAEREQAAAAAKAKAEAERLQKAEKDAKVRAERDAEQGKQKEARRQQAEAARVVRQATIKKAMPVAIGVVVTILVIVGAVVGVVKYRRVAATAAAEKIVAAVAAQKVAAAEAAAKAAAEEAAAKVAAAAAAEQKKALELDVAKFRAAAPTLKSLSVTELNGLWDRAKGLRGKQVVVDAIEAQLMQQSETWAKALQAQYTADPKNASAIQPGLTLLQENLTADLRLPAKSTLDSLAQALRQAAEASAQSTARERWIQAVKGISDLLQLLGQIPDAPKSGDVDAAVLECLNRSKLDQASEGLLGDLQTALDRESSRYPQSLALVRERVGRLQADVKSRQQKFQTAVALFKTVEKEAPEWAAQDVSAKLRGLEGARQDWVQDGAADRDPATFAAAKAAAVASVKALIEKNTGAGRRERLDAIDLALGEPAASVLGENQRQAFLSLVKIQKALVLVTVSNASGIEVDATVGGKPVRLAANTPTQLSVNGSTQPSIEFRPADAGYLPTNIWLQAVKEGVPLVLSETFFPWKPGRVVVEGALEGVIVQVAAAGQPFKPVASADVTLPAASYQFQFSRADCTDVTKTVVVGRGAVTKVSAPNASEWIATPDKREFDQIAALMGKAGAPLAEDAPDLDRRFAKVLTLASPSHQQAYKGFKSTWTQYVQKTATDFVRAAEARIASAQAARYQIEDPLSPAVFRTDLGATTSAAPPAWLPIALGQTGDTALQSRLDNVVKGKVVLKPTEADQARLQAHKLYSEESPLDIKDDYSLTSLAAFRDKGGTPNLYDLKLGAYIASKFWENNVGGVKVARDSNPGEATAASTAIGNKRPAATQVYANLNKLLRGAPADALEDLARSINAWAADPEPLIAGPVNLMIALVNSGLPSGDPLAALAGKVRASAGVDPTDLKYLRQILAL